MCFLLTLSLLLLFLTRAHNAMSQIVPYSHICECRPFWSTRKSRSLGARIPVLERLVLLNDGPLAGFTSVAQENNESSLVDQSCCYGRTWSWPGERQLYGRAGPDIGRTCPWMLTFVTSWFYVHGCCERSGVWFQQLWKMTSYLFECLPHPPPWLTQDVPKQNLSRLLVNYMKNGLIF